MFQQPGRGKILTSIFLNHSAKSSYIMKKTLIPGPELFLFLQQPWVTEDAVFKPFIMTL